MAVSIHERRNAKKLTQKELGKLCGVSQQCIQMIESGKRLPRILLAMKIAQVLDCRIDELWNDRL